MPSKPTPASDLPWQIRMAKLKDLKSAERNVRTHSKRQIQKIANSISSFGIISPIVVDPHDQIVIGHGRAAACKLLKIVRVPVILASHLTETQLRALALADNRIAEDAGWDKELLAIELQDLQTQLADLEIDLDVTGFEPAEVDALFTDLHDEQSDDDEDLPAPPEKPISRLGDIYILGRHRLLVGDARDSAAYDALLQGKAAEMAITDPPYNVRIQGHVGGRGKIKRKEFICGSGEMSPEEFASFLKQSLGLCAANTTDGAINIVSMDWRHMREMLDAGDAVYDELKNVCVWTKTSPGQGSFYRSQHELFFIYKHGTAPHLNNFELGQHGRSRSNVWRYAGANSFRAGRMDELRMHPTVKPVALIADAMKDCSRRGAIILDPFCGSGSTVIAAEKVGRRAFCIELDPAYVDVSINRWQALTKQDAVLEETGLTFTELEKQRNSASNISTRHARKSIHQKA